VVRIVLPVLLLLWLGSCAGLSGGAGDLANHDEACERHDGSACGTVEHRCVVSGYAGD
jgi:hypothetical protein